MVDSAPVKNIASASDLQDCTVDQLIQKISKKSTYPQVPVAAPHDGAPIYLVQSIDITVAEMGVKLVFLDSLRRSRSVVVFYPEKLRQWLSVLLSQFIKAQRPLGEWPPWIRDGQAFWPDLN